MRFAGFRAPGADAARAAPHFDRGLIAGGHPVASVAPEIGEMPADGLKALDGIQHRASPIFRMTAREDPAIAGKTRDTLAIELGIGDEIDANVMGREEAQQM